MQRRKFLQRSIIGAAGITAASLIGWRYYFDGPIKNPCLLDDLPQQLRQHPLMLIAFEGLKFDQLWDCHFHLVGSGVGLASDGNPSGIWINPSMSSWRYPKRRLQYGFYLNAGCINNAHLADIEYIQSVDKLIMTLPKGIRLMLLAFDYYHDDAGTRQQHESTIYVPNEYAARLARLNNSFEWIASVHPYRADALSTLEWCAKNGAKAVKWLPPAMNIDPSSNQCQQYYAKLIELGLPLLTHAGEEQAVHSDKLQALANPLLLRTPLEQGVKVIVAHCATLGQSQDIETIGKPMRDNFELFSRLMNEKKYNNNLLADISALNLFNRNISEIKQVLTNQHWHPRLLYASDFPLPGVMPIISSKNLASHGLLSAEEVIFLNKVKNHNVWLFDFLQKRMLQVDGMKFGDSVFNTRRHFERL